MFFCLAGDMGGSIGLCLGGSLLTVVEIIDIIFFSNLFKSTGQRG